MPGEQRSVGVVIPCYNQKRFLRKAIESAAAQSRRPNEIIVIDDGSREDLTPITRAYPGVHLIRQDNRGLAAARNTGLRAAASDKIIFLDADDVLLPGAISSGLECFAKSPRAAFVYGGFCIVSRAGREIEFSPVASHRDLIRTNWIGMIGAVMFDRVMLLAHDGFDEALGMCEDWDAYLRLSRHLPFVAHPNIVANYIRHGANASNRISELREWIEVVRAKEWDRGLDAEDRKAWDEGKELWRSRVPDPRPAFLTRRIARRPARLLRRWLGM